MENLKIKDLVMYLNSQSNVLIYRACKQDPSDDFDFEDIYEGLFWFTVEDIPDSLINLNIHTMFPYLRNNKPYIYIQVRR